MHLLLENLMPYILIITGITSMIVAIYAYFHTKKIEEKKDCSLYR